MLATKRPVFFKDSSTCLARRTIDPPGGATGSAEGLLTKAAVTGIRTHLRSSCLTLLRNFLSVTSGCWEILSTALAQSDMQAQADRALQASRQQLDLMMGGRAARNRAAIFYEWDTSADDSRAAKRQRDTDDAEARVRAAKMARGLGSGIQLPTSMVDACELVLLNLNNLPPKRPPVAASARKHAINLDFVVDAVLTNGASLSIDENHWYDRDGGDAWIMEERDVGGDSRRALTFTLNSTVFAAAEKAALGSELKDSEKAFAEQSKIAASMAFSRILQSSSNAHSEAVADFGKQLAARLAWTLKGVQPSNDIEGAHAMAVEATEKSLRKDTDSEEALAGSLEFALDYPLVSSCLAYDLVPKGSTAPMRDDSGSGASSTSSLAMRILNEAYISSFDENKENYEKCLDVFVASVVNACDLSNKTPNDSEKKRIANSAASSLPQQLAVVPSVTRTSLNLVGSLCDIEEICKRASTKTSQQTIAESAALHAAKAAAEKRATAALLILRDVALQRDALRGPAVDCAVAIASGRLPGSPSIEDKALKLVMNVIFSKNSDCADKVVESATKELELATRYAIDNHEAITKANESIAKKKEKEKQRHGPKAPQSDEEKVALNRVRKPVVLFMALCVRRPEIIKALMEMSCREGADVLAKAVKTNMPKLTKAVSVKFGKLSACCLHCLSDLLISSPTLLTFSRRSCEHRDKGV
jgi:symplekin